LSPPASVGVAIGTTGLVLAIYAFSMPNVATMHGTDAHDVNIDKARKKAAIMAGLAAGAAALLSRDLNPWILGGGAIILSDIFVRHANVTHPDTGDVVSDEQYGPPIADTGNYAEEYPQ